MERLIIQDSEGRRAGAIDLQCVAGAHIIPTHPLHGCVGWTVGIHTEAGTIQDRFDTNRDVAMARVDHILGAIDACHDPDSDEPVEPTTGRWQLTSVPSTGPRTVDVGGLSAVNQTRVAAIENAGWTATVLEHSDGAFSVRATHKTRNGTCTWTRPTVDAAVTAAAAEIATAGVLT